MLKSLMQMWSLPSALLILSLGTGIAQAQSFRETGVHPIDNGSPNCVTTRKDQAPRCADIALADNHTVANLNVQTRTIQLTNSQAYASKTLLVDVFLPATGLTDKQVRVPLVLHAKLSKAGQKWSIETHAHAPVKGVFKVEAMDAWHIAVEDGNRSTVLLDADQEANLVSNPSLAARMARQFVNVLDNRATPQAHPDLTLQLGLGKAAYSLVRSRYTLADNAPLEKGTWAIELNALSSAFPKDVVAHELFLYGLNQVDLLKEVNTQGLRKGQSIVVGAKDGKGYIQFEGKTQDFPQAAVAARQYLRLSFLGLIVDWQQATHAH